MLVYQRVNQGFPGYTTDPSNVSLLCVSTCVPCHFSEFQGEMEMSSGSQERCWTHGRVSQTRKGTPSVRKLVWGSSIKYMSKCDLKVWNDGSTKVYSLQSRRAAITRRGPDVSHPRLLLSKTPKKHRVITPMLHRGEKENSRFVSSVRGMARKFGFVHLKHDFFGVSKTWVPRKNKNTSFWGTRNPRGSPCSLKVDVCRLSTASIVGNHLGHQQRPICLDIAPCRLGSQCIFHHRTGNQHGIQHWLVVLTILTNMKVNGKDDIPYMKWKILVNVPVTTNQNIIMFPVVKCCRFQFSETPHLIKACCYNCYPLVIQHSHGKWPIYRWFAY